MRKVILFYLVLLLSLAIIGLIGCGEDSEEAEDKGGAGPSIFNMFPKNKSKDIPTTTAVLVTFNKDIATPSSANMAFTPGVSGNVSYDKDTLTMIFEPSSPLNNHTDYSITIDGVTDLEGNSMSPVTISFTTSLPDTKSPEVIFTFPEDEAKDVGHDATILIRFSEPIYRSKLRNGIAFSPKVDVPSDGWFIEWGLSEEEEVTISPPAGTDPFEVNEEYTLVLLRDSVVDVSGNPILADYKLDFHTLKYPVEKIGRLDFPNGLVAPHWMYAVGRWGNKWVVIWGGMQPRGAPSQNAPSGTITASADGQILDGVETFPSNANNVFTPTVTKGNGNRMTFSTVALNNNRSFRMIFSSTSTYVTFDLRSSAGTLPAQYVHIGNNFENPSRTPFIMKNK